MMSGPGPWGPPMWGFWWIVPLILSAEDIKVMLQA